MRAARCLPACAFQRLPVPSVLICLFVGDGAEGGVRKNFGVLRELMAELVEIRDNQPEAPEAAPTPEATDVEAAARLSEAGQRVLAGALGQLAAAERRLLVAAEPAAAWLRVRLAGSRLAESLPLPVSSHVGVVAVTVAVMAVILAVLLWLKALADAPLAEYCATDGCIPGVGQFVCFLYSASHVVDLPDSLREVAGCVVLLTVVQHLGAMLLAHLPLEGKQASPPYVLPPLLTHPPSTPTPEPLATPRHKAVPVRLQSNTIVVQWLCLSFVSIGLCVVRRALEVGAGGYQFFLLRAGVTDRNAQQTRAYGTPCGLNPCFVCLDVAWASAAGHGHWACRRRRGLHAGGGGRCGGRGFSGRVRAPLGGGGRFQGGRPGSSDGAGGAAAADKPEVGVQGVFVHHCQKHARHGERRGDVDAAHHGAGAGALCSQQLAPLQAHPVPAGLRSRPGAGGSSDPGCRRAV